MRVLKHAFLDTAILLALISCGSGKSDHRASEGMAPSLRPLNVVIVTVDTLRPDRLRCYGNQAIDTPAFDGLVSRGAQFQNAVAQTPLTPPSHASIFTGTNPNVHHVRNTGGFVLDPSSTTLATILKAKGWDTAAFVGASVLKKAVGFGIGFDVYDDQMPKAENSTEEREYPERRAAVVVDHALRWLNTQSGKPFLLWVHLYDPHEPYDPPEPFHRKYSKNLYDGEVAYTDQQLGRLLNAVSSRSSPDKTVIVVLADHAESLGDHGEFNHGVFLYDSTLRIPLFILGPGIPAVKVAQQVRTIDVLPTVLDLLGGTPPVTVQGTSLKPLFSGKPVASTYSYQETVYPKMNMGWADLEGVRTDKWKYVRAPRPELYDLLHDPAETHNVIDDHPAELKELANLLEKLSRAGGGTDQKIKADGMDSQTYSQLKSLGYLSGGSSGDIQLNGKGADPKDRTATLLAFQTALGPQSRKLSAVKRIAVLKQALAQDSTNPSLYFYLTAEYEKAGNYDQALLLCETAQQNGVRSGRLLARMGDLYLRKGKKDQAIAAYEEAAQYNPSDAENQTNLATAYLERGNLDNAERCFKSALKVEDYAPAYNGLGLIAVQRHDAVAAQQQFERAVSLDPHLMEAQLNLGLIYKMAGDKARAKDCFEAFLAQAPPAKYGEVITQVRQELEAMR